MLQGFPWLPLHPAERSVPRMLQLQAARYGGKPLFECMGERWTFADAPDIAARTAGALIAGGVKPGERVAILSRNRPEVMRLLLGCAWAGAVAVPLNAASRGRQLRYYLENSGARLLAAEPSLLAEAGSEALSGLPLERIWLLGEAIANECFRPSSGASRHLLPVKNREKESGGAVASSFSPWKRGEGPAGDEGLDTNGDTPWVPGAEEAPAAPHESSPLDPFAILYTSGTTGPPKGVICPHGQFHWWGIHTARFLELREGDVLATTLPLFHTNAINTFFQALLTGSKLVVLPKFSASGFWRQMGETGATAGYLLGAMVPMLLAQPPSGHERSHKLRIILGPGVPPAMHEALFERTGVCLVDGFGSTETNFAIGGTASERQSGRMGKPSPGVQAKAVDGAGFEVPAGEAGELLLRADEPDCFSSGYFGMPDETAKAWREGWFHTGDRVIRHADASFAFVDRLKDMIRRRGENISSFEVEQAVMAHPAVAAAAVFPVPSDLAEDEVMAAIALREGAALTAEDFFAHCARELPRHCVPRYVEFMAELPRTENGKVEKFKLRERGVTEAAFDRLKS